MGTTKKTNKTEATQAEVVQETKVSAKTHKAKRAATQGWSSKFFWGMLLITLGVMFTLENYLELDAWSNFWPVVIILVGFSIVIGSFEKGGE